jgi:hypothetical protein
MTRIYVEKALRYGGIVVLSLIALVLFLMLWSLLRYVLFVVGG